MLQITCSGTPYEIGLQHGREASAQITGSIDFYSSLFLKNAKLPWEKVQTTALRFEIVIREKWPEYLEEIRGIADGSNHCLSSILALNVRTEINFGLFSDGCTALSWHDGSSSFLAQNWDWMPTQRKNLILLTIHQAPKPTIKMVTEAGLIGKIGLNSSGVGVCLNAIRAKGLDTTRIPCHLALRLALDSTSAAVAIRGLKGYGVASACHVLVADGDSGTGCEFSAVDSRFLDADEAGRVFHTNHYLTPHEGVTDTVWLEDSRVRIVRVRELCDEFGEDGPTLQRLQGVFRDEMGFPTSICRKEEGENESGTLFNIVMDLGNKRAKVVFGRPTEPEGIYDIGF